MLDELEAILHRVAAGESTADDADKLRRCVAALERGLAEYRQIDKYICFKKNWPTVEGDNGGGP